MKLFTTAAHIAQNAIIPYQGRPTKEVEDIMKRVVADNSNITYRNNNIILILWLYDNETHREEVLRDWMIEELNRAVSAEKETEATRNKRSAARAVYRKALDNSNIVDKNCPILLDKLPFNRFPLYHTTRKDRDGDLLSKAGYGQIRSALKHLYRMCSEKFDDDYDEDLSQFMSGLKRTVASSRAASGRSLDEGKKGMSFKVYKAMCEILFKSDHDDDLFAHAFLTMEWNLFARSDNCFTMHVKHIEF